MAPVNDNPRRRVVNRAVIEQAEELLFDAEEQGGARNEAIADWLRESPKHGGAMMRSLMIDAALKRFDPDKSFPLEPFPRGELPDIPSSPVPDDENEDETDVKSWALAAGLACLAVLAGILIRWGAPIDDGWRTYQTAVGEQRSVQLEDGSLLTLNTDSRVEVRLAANQRQVRLLSGEALFKVAHNKERPFRVSSGDSVIQAVGTQFNVYRRGNQTTVAVLEGRVAVVSADSPFLRSTAAPSPLESPYPHSLLPKERESKSVVAARIPAPSEAEGQGEVERPSNASGSSVVYLNVGEQVVVADGAPAPQRMNVDVDQISSWRDRRLTFDDVPLSTIAYELNRYNRSPKIHVEGENAQRRRYAVILDANDPESLIAVLSADPQVSIDRHGDEILVRERRH